jgi:hypothetical protein
MLRTDRTADLELKLDGAQSSQPSTFDLLTANNASEVVCSAKRQKVMEPLVNDRIS